MPEYSIIKGRSPICWNIYRTLGRWNQSEISVELLFVEILRTSTCIPKAGLPQLRDISNSYIINILYYLPASKYAIIKTDDHHYQAQFSSKNEKKCKVLSFRKWPFASHDPPQRERRETRREQNGVHRSEVFSKTQVCSIFKRYFGRK